MQVLTLGPLRRGEQEGLSKEEIGRAQHFESEDPTRAAALKFAHDTVQNRGHTSDEVFEEIQQAGYTDEQVTEIVANIALTN